MVVANKNGKSRRTSSNLPATLYCYVEERNARWAKSFGKQVFGSFSSYVNALIAKDQGIKPLLGAWKSRGEAKKLWKEAKAKEKLHSKARTVRRHKRAARIAKEVA